MIVVLGITTRYNSGKRMKYNSCVLLYKIDCLSDKDIITLTKNIENFIPRMATITIFLENFTQSLLGLLFSVISISHD